MSTSKQIPWGQFLFEGVLIVVSILLAFGIQAWWDGVPTASRAGSRAST